MLSSEARPTSGIKGRNGKGCLRCGFEVYAAEQMISKNKVLIFNFFRIMSKEKS